MEILSVLGFCLISAVLVLFLNHYRPEYAMFAAAAAGCLVLVWIAKLTAPYFSEFYFMLANAGVQTEYFKVVIKAFGICYITRFASDLCKDFGQSAMSDKVELAGRGALLALTIPLIQTILNISMELLK